MSKEILVLRGISFSNISILFNIVLLKNNAAMKVSSGLKVAKNYKIFNLFGMNQRKEELL